MSTHIPRRQPVLAFCVNAHKLSQQQGLYVTNEQSSLLQTFKKVQPLGSGCFLKNQEHSQGSWVPEMISGPSGKVPNKETDYLVF